MSGLGKNFSYCSYCLPVNIIIAVVVVIRSKCPSLPRLLAIFVKLHIPPHSSAGEDFTAPYIDTLAIDVISPQSGLIDADLRTTAFFGGR